MLALAERVDYHWNMSAIRIRSLDAPFDSPAIARKAMGAISRAEAMGLLVGLRGGIDRLDLPTFRRLLDAISMAGIGPALIADLRAGRGTDAKRIAKALDGLQDALAGSPSPGTEWPQLESVLGCDLLARLTCVSPSSLRRYLRSARVTPDDVAARAHFLALVLGHLAGAYNDIGIRRWFDRKRSHLQGRSPGSFLVGRWNPDNAEPRRILALAEALQDAPTT